MSINNYEYVIWDWNGTLFDDVALCVDIMNGILLKYNLPRISVEKYRSFFDFPVENYYKKLGFDFRKDSFEKLGIEFIEQYNRRRFESNLHKGAHELLKTFNKLGIQQFILSAREHNSLIDDLKYYNVFSYILDISGLDNHLAGGKLALGVKMMNKLDINPEKCLLIGDTKHDAEVAAGLKIDCILLAHGHHNFKQLSMMNVPVFDNFQELKEYILM